MSEGAKGSSRWIATGAAVLLTLLVGALCLSGGDWASARLYSVVDVFRDVHVSFPVNRTLLHLALFLLLGWVYGSLAKGTSLATRALVAVWAVAVGLELLQVFVPRRSLSPFDLLANLVGATSGFALSRLLKTAVATLRASWHEARAEG